MIKRLLNKSDFTKNVATLFTGTFIAQIIPIAIAPILSRIYTPEDFAINEVFMRIFGIAIIFSTLRFEQAIVLPKDDRRSYALIKIIFIISLIIAVLLFLVNVLLGNWISETQNSPDLYLYLYLLPVAIIVSANFQSTTYWNLRHKQFKRLSVSKITTSLSNSTVKITLGILTSGNPIGLIASNIIGQIIGLGTLLYRKSKSLINSTKSISKNEIIEVTKEYRDFPRINTFHALLDAFREAAIIYMIFHFYGNNTLGLYAFTIRLMKIPLGMIGTSIGQVFFQKASEIKNHQQNLYQLTLKTIKKLILFSLPIFILIGLLAGWVFEFVFGEEWLTAGYLAQIFTPWMFFHFLNSPLSQIPMIIEKQKEFFLLSILGFAISIGGLFIGGVLFDSPIHGLALFSSFQCLYFMFLIFWLLRIARKFDKQLNIN